MSRFGFSTAPSTGNDFIPSVKYNATAGRMFRVDREMDPASQTYISTDIDITSTFKALFDLENVETGWVTFIPRPDFRLVPVGDPIPPRPPGVDEKGKPSWSNGVRIMLKLSKECGGEKPIREITGNSKALLSAFELLMDAYDEQKGGNPGKLPIVEIDGQPRPVKTTPPGKPASTSYHPTFKIVGWAPRGDLVFQPKGGTTAQVEQIKQAAATPPSTGSTLAAPPVAKQPEMAETDDFG